MGANTQAACSNGVCIFQCAGGFADCDKNTANGCEINLKTSVQNCGACGKTCPQGPVCFDGSCDQWSKVMNQSGTKELLAAPNQYLIGGFECTAYSASNLLQEFGTGFCPYFRILSKPSGFNVTSSKWTDPFSEEGDKQGKNERACPVSSFVTGIRCSGKYCDNVSLQCSELNNGGVKRNCYWTPPMYEIKNKANQFTFPEGMYMAGLRCQGRYCSQRSFMLCSPSREGFSMDPNESFKALAYKFAPRIYFDQKVGTNHGLGKNHPLCFPSNPEEYFTQRKMGVKPIDLCKKNQNYENIKNNKVPVFYLVRQCGTNMFLIRYWWFYPWHGPCFPWKSHEDANWEGITVKIVNEKLRDIQYYFRGREGWGRWIPDKFFQTTHPIVYSGKILHETWPEASGHSGGCFLGVDFSNPGPKDYHMDTWNNLVPLKPGAGVPTWMNCNPYKTNCFDGSPHPIVQTGDPCSYSDCSKKKQGGGGVITRWCMLNQDPQPYISWF